MDVVYLVSISGLSCSGYKLLEKICKRSFSETYTSLLSFLHNAFFILLHSDIFIILVVLVRRNHFKC